MRREINFASQSTLHRSFNYGHHQALRRVTEPRRQPSAIKSLALSRRLAVGQRGRACNQRLDDRECVKPNRLSKAVARLAWAQGN